MDFFRTVHDMVKACGREKAFINNILKRSVAAPHELYSKRLIIDGRVGG